MRLSLTEPVNSVVLTPNSIADFDRTPELFPKRPLVKPMLVDNGQGDRAQQSPGIFVLRSTENRGAIAGLDDPSMLHNRHAIAQGSDDRQVVADEDHSQRIFRSQLTQQSQHLRLHRYVQTGDDFVGHDEGRCERDGARNPHALPLTAR